jgi:hypothetical protein
MFRQSGPKMLLLEGLFSRTHTHEEHRLVIIGKKKKKNPHDIS